MGAQLASIRWIMPLVLGMMAGSPCLAWQASETVPTWIWAPQHQAGHVPQTSCFFRKIINLPPFRSASLAIAADDQFELHVNGRLAGQGNAEQGIVTLDLSRRLRPGDNTLALKVTNREGATAGLAARLVVQDAQDKTLTFVTDPTWKSSLTASIFWTRASYLDTRWTAAKPLGPYADFVARQLATVAPKSQDSAAESVPQPTPATEVPTPAAAPPIGATGSKPLTRQPESGAQLEVPREFELQQVAGHADTGSLTAMTFNEFGQLIAVREDGQLWILVDQDQDGSLDRLRNYGHLMKTCQGLLSLNGSLYVTGLGDQGLGLYRLSDTNQDGQLDQSTRVLAFDGENIEHGPHGITLGPDGMLYVMVGNHSPLATSYATTSAYRYPYEGDLLEPRYLDPGGHATGVKAPGGYVLRLDPDGTRVEIHAGGFRNAYDLAFNQRGALFTHDSDMESDRGTTWYRPTRVYHVIDGAEFGWRSGWAKWPEYYLDCLPGIADTGRGSPTGMVVYDHEMFPAMYRNALFSCDWSEGRIWVIPCREEGASYEANPKEFVKGQPLNVTDIDVGPDGALYFVTGGRATAGNVYRVIWKGYVPRPPRADRSGIDLVLQQPQLNSSWGRQQIAVQKQQLVAEWDTQLPAAAADVNRSDAERIQALQIMQWVGPSPSRQLLTQLTGDRRVAVRRKATYLLGLKPQPKVDEQLTHLLSDADPVVRRRACEGLVRQGQAVELAKFRKHLASSDRFEAWAARRILETVPQASWQSEVLTTDNQRIFLVGATALMLAAPETANAQAVLTRSLQLMDGFVTDDNFVDLLRVQQLALLRSKLPANTLQPLGQRLADEYPSSSARINRELIRLLVRLQVDSITDRYVAELAKDWPAPEKIHLAMHLTYLNAGWSTAQKLAVFQHLASPPGAGNSIPGYLQNAAFQLGQQLKGEELTTALSVGHENPGAALAALLRLPDQLSSVQLERIQRLDEQLATEQLGAADEEMERRLKVVIIAILARDGRAPATDYLRTIYDRDPTRRVEAALGLAETSDEKNWPFLVRSLPILDPADAKTMLTKLQQMRRGPEDAESYRQVILTAERLGNDGADEAIALLERWQGYAATSKSVEWESALVAWKQWFQQKFPDENVPELIVSSSGGKWDEQALLKHLTRAEQESKGSAERGRAVFAKAQCASCHRLGSQGESMGPDLTGLGKRFLKREILDSLLYPSKVISDQYAAKVVSTNSGMTYVGIVALGPGEELTVLESTGKKIRIPNAEIDEIQPARTSAMPEGLLNELSLEEITDLFAYLLSHPDRLTKAESSADLSR